MKIGTIQTIITPKTTGYAALITTSLTIASGISKNKSSAKLHKPLACVSAALALIHLGLIEYYHHKYKIVSNN